MGSITDKMAKFATQVQFTDLPEKVSHEMKRVILDSIGCAIVGSPTEKGSIAAKLATKLGGPLESTIIGTKDRVSSANAAFANGESIHAVDWDSTGPGGHDTPSLIGSALAIAESCGVSGKDLILAVALSYETTARLASITIGAAPRPGKGDMHWSPLVGQSGYTIAAAVSAGKILNLDQQKMANAIGIAGCICPVSMSRNMFQHPPFRMTRYGAAGPAAQAGITSALLAEMGYTGDTELFDGEYSFWRYTGLVPRGEEVLSDLGVEWYSTRITYKLYPCASVLQGVMDKFTRIIEENDFQPDDIEKVGTKPHPVLPYKAWRENTLRTPDDQCFSGPYLLACAAHRLNRAHWHDPEVRQDPKILDFIKKASPAVDEKDFASGEFGDPRKSTSSMEMVAKGKTFREETPQQKGRWTPDEFRATDQELVEKFIDNASRILHPNRAKEAAQTLLELEKVGNIAQIIEMVSP